MRAREEARVLGSRNASRGWEAAVRAREEARVLGARNASHGVLPTAGKREWIFF